MKEKDPSSEFLQSLDRRTSENDVKISSVQRDYSEVTHTIQEVLNRINGGLSPSVNEVKKENHEIKMALKDLGHDIDKQMGEMKEMVKESSEHTRLMVDNFDKHRLQPTEREVGFIRKTFIYGAVGALVVFAGEKTLNLAWEKLFERRAPHVITVP